jgi:hypothetical protein
MPTVVRSATPATPSASRSFRALLARSRTLVGALGAGLLVASSALGCAVDEGDSGERYLSGRTLLAVATADGWKATPHFDDPRFEGPGPKVTCDAGALHAEAGVVEVSTADCNFALLKQPLMADVDAGDEIVLRAWWGSPAGPAPSTARLSLFLGLREIWQESVAVPGQADVREVRLVSPVSAPAGTLLLFRVNAPGANEWSLSEVSVFKDDAKAESPTE